jgi:hypothetical protein
MNSSTRAVSASTIQVFIGLDVHKDTLSGAFLPAFAPHVADRFQGSSSPNDSVGDPAPL